MKRAIKRDFLKSQKSVLSNKNQSFTIANISQSRKIQKKSLIRKTVNSRKNLVPHGIWITSELHPLCAFVQGFNMWDLIDYSCLIRKAFDRFVIKTNFENIFYNWAGLWQIYVNEGFLKPRRHVCWLHKYILSWIHKNGRYDWMTGLKRTSY